MVCESPTENLIKLSKKLKFEVKLISGVSFIDAMFTLLNFDPGYGFQHLTASQLYDENLKKKISPSLHTMISCISYIPQKGLAKTEYDITLDFLNETYPSRHRVIILFSSLSGNYKVEKIITTIKELSQFKQVIKNNRVTLFVPPRRF